MNRRALIRMTADEALDFLAEQRTVIVASNGRDGWPHLMPIWYVLRDGGLWGWTYAKSQKARNLERDPRATLQVEAGEAYAELRGVMLRANAVLHSDPEVVESVAMELVDRYGGGDPVREMFRAQVPKRVGLEFVECDRVSWDHGKLAGTY